MSQILKPGESYYEFVVAVAQKAREIAGQAEKEHVCLEEKPVTLAVQMFASGEQKLSDLNVTIGRQGAAVASEAAPDGEPVADDVLELEEDDDIDTDDIDDEDQADEE